MIDLYDWAGAMTGRVTLSQLIGAEVSVAETRSMEKD